MLVTRKVVLKKVLASIQIAKGGERRQVIGDVRREKVGVLTQDSDLAGTFNYLCKLRSVKFSMDPK